MLKVKTVNENFLTLFFVGIISGIFALLILQYNYKAIVFLLLFVIALVFFMKVEYVFYLLLLSRSIIDLFYSSELAGNARVTHYIGVLVIVLFSSYFIITGYNIFRFGVNRVYLVLMFFAFLPVFFTGSLKEGFASWLKLLLPILVLNMAILVIKNSENESAKNYEEKVNKICWCIIISTFIPYVLFLKNIIHGNTVKIMGGYARYSGFSAHANEFSYYLLVVFSVCLFFYSISAKRSGKIIWLVAMGIILFTIYKTYTRNVWIGAAMLIGTWNLLRKNVKFLVASLLLIAVLAFFHPDVRNRFSDLSEILQSESVSDLDPRLLSGRVNRWTSNIQYFMHKSTLIEKIFGNGFDVKSKVMIFSDSFSDVAAPEHNNYLTLLMNTGILGLFAYCLYLFLLFRESFKLLIRANDIYFKNFAQVFISVISSYVVMCVFTHIIWKVSFQWFFSSLAGVVIAGTLLLKERDRGGSIRRVDSFNQ